MHQTFFAILLFSSIVSSVRIPLMPVEVDLLDTSKGLLDTPDGQPLSPTNVLFYAEMEIGTPFQSFRVLLDTSTSLSYVTIAGSDIKNRGHCNAEKLPSGCDPQLDKLSRERNRYSSEKSETADRHKLPTPHMEKRLAPGTHLATDVICLGKLCAKKTPFVLKSKDDEDIVSLPCDGVLGLAHQTASELLLMPVIDKLATEDKTIEHSFTIWTKDVIRAGQMAGFLTIGEVDAEHCNGDYLTLKVQKAKYWEFHVQQIIVKKMAIHGNHGRPLRAIMNSRQNLLAARPEIIDKLVDHFKAKETKEGYHINCHQIPELPVMKFDVTLENASVQFLVLRPDDYTFKKGANCFLAFSKSRKILEADLEFGTFVSRNFCQTYKYGKGADEEQFASIVMARKKTY